MNQIPEKRTLRRGDIYDKNKDLLTDDVLGKKKKFNKYHNPLDPQYIMRSASGHKQMMYG